jgi:hypothetical protein
MAASLPACRRSAKGGAGPVSGLLGGKDLTGRFFSEVRNQKSRFVSYLLILDS